MEINKARKVNPIIHEPTRPIWEDPQVNNPTPTTVPIVILIDSLSPSTLSSFCLAIILRFCCDIYRFVLYCAAKVCNLIIFLCFVCQKDFILSL